MSTIEEIDETHMEYRVKKYWSGSVFRPAKYKTYGGARKAMKELMEAAGYESLSQKEKEIVGRWNLITDTEEIASLFDVTERTRIEETYKSYIKPLISGSPVSTRSKDYYTVDEIIYMGTLFSEILLIYGNIRVNSPGTTYSVRIFDSTNINVIAEKTGLSNLRPEIIDLGAVSNIPDNDVLLEVQVKRTGGNGRIYYKSVQLQIV